MKAKRITSLACVLAAATGVVACGDDDDNTSSSEGSGGSAKTLNVYSSLPMQGATSEQAEAIVRGIKLALEQAGGKAGDFKIKFEALDDSTAQAGTWTPEATSANARKAAQDDNAIAYIGEFNSGASAVSMPILNEAMVPQISPGNTAVGLTSDEPGSTTGEPEKYYPSGDRHYVRISLKDTIQSAAMATVMREDGCTSVALTNDKEVYGAGLATNLTAELKERGVKLLFNEGIDPKAPNFRALASRARTGGADCFVFAGITANGSVQIFKDFAAALPEAKLYGPDGVAESGFTNPGQGGIPANVQKRVKLTVATLDPDSYPPDGQKFFDLYEKTHGDRTPDPYAIYGYEAMSLALDAIERSGTGEREDVVEALFATKDRESVLGTYSIDENGDSTLTDYGVYTVEKGHLVFDKRVAAGS